MLTGVTAVLTVNARGTLSVSAGIGRRFEDIMELRSGFVQAQTALKIGRQLEGARSVTHFDDLGVYRILANYTKRQELKHYCSDVLGELLAADGQTRADLLRTLEAVLEANGNLKKAARDLFVHYNTLRHRASRIEELIGVDLDSSEDRLRLQVALKTLRMQDST